MSVRKKYEHQILEKVRELPMARVVETLDFVSFLEDQEELRAQGDTIDVSDEEFEVLLADCFGKWKGEVDGVTYANRFRATWKDRYGGKKIT